MSDLVFDFCDTSRVIQELPPEEPQVRSMNGWSFAPRPKVPYQREFKAKLSGMRWYLDPTGTILDTVTNSKFNAGRLLQFYRDHRLWDSFLINHEYLGTLRVRFKKPVIIPEAIPDSGGKIDMFEVEFIHHDPSY